MSEIYKTWTELKSVSIAKSLPFQYKQFDYHYRIFIDEKNITYFTELWTDTSQVDGINITQNNIDLSDWELNYKASANQPYPQNPDTFDVNVSSGDLDANIIGGTVNVVESRYRPKFYKSNVDIDLSQSSDTELANINVDGKLDAISVNFTRDDVEFVLEIDGIEILRILLNELKRSTHYNLGGSS